jgi:tRNA dimethylallyltransferase
VVGGTGLYLRAALTNLSLRPPPPEDVREHWISELSRLGAPALHRRLAERAPWAAAAIEPGDSQRIVRALELLDIGELEPAPSESELWTDDVRRSTLLIGLVRPRDQLYSRIDARVEQMVKAGAGDQVRRASAAGASATARKALGFEELLADDVDGMKRRTRNYARRQLTWMRKLAGMHEIDLGSRAAEDAAAEVLSIWLQSGEPAQG